MNIKTANPIIIDNKVVKGTEEYMSLSGPNVPQSLSLSKYAGPTADTSKKIERKEKARAAVQKVGSFAKETGIVDGLVGRLKDTLGIAQNQPEQVYVSAPPDAPQKEGMSKNTKIIIAIGGAIAFGTIIYVIARKKK